MVYDAIRITGVAVLSAVALLLGDRPALEAQETTATRVMIRVTSHDAKIIGSGVGGARVTIRDASSGELLARGTQEGGTGDTGKLVVDPRSRHAPVYDTDGAAGFLAELDLERPTRVEILAEGPLGTPHATQRATRTMLLVPGRDVLGNGVVLELYGFTVELESPTRTERVSAGGTVPVRARVTMLCGCPIEPGGLWDADDYTIEARLVQDGRVIERSELGYAGTTSTFEGRIPVPRSDDLELQVVAMDPDRGNFGIVQRPLTIDAEGEE